MTQARLILVHDSDEREAWQAFQAMVLAERAQPCLCDNPFWAELRKEAHSRWQRLFVVA